MKRRFVYCKSLGNGVMLECDGTRVVYIIPKKKFGIEEDVYVELAMREGECDVNIPGDMRRSASRRVVINSHLHWIDGKFSFIKDDVEEHDLHPTQVLLLITDPRAVEHTYLNAVTRSYRQQFSNALRAMREHGVHLVDVKSDEHTVELIFNSIVYTISKGQ